MNVTYLGEQTTYSKGTNAPGLRVYVTVFLLATLAFAGVALVLGLLELPNSVHARTFHPESDAARARMRAGECLRVQAHYSVGMGTVLILCQFANGEWAGQVARVTMDNGRTFLADSCYECTLFVANWDYWAHVIVRDGYDRVPPELWDKLQTYIGGA